MATPLPMSCKRIGRSVAITRLKKPTLAQFRGANTNGATDEQSLRHAPWPISRDRDPDGPDRSARSSGSPWIGDTGIVQHPAGARGGSA